MFVSLMLLIKMMMLCVVVYGVTCVVGVIFVVLVYGVAAIVVVDYVAIATAVDIDIMHDTVDCGIGVVGVVIAVIVVSGAVSCCVVDVAGRGVS